MWLGLLAMAVLAAGFYYRHQVQEGYRYVGKRAAPLRAIITPVPLRFKEILKNYFPYYNQLKPDHKRKFERKLVYFIFSKYFIPRNFGGVTDEMKVLIAASAVQLTFGLPRVFMAHFNRILIYPDDYYSEITRRYHRGEVNPAYRTIVLSWRSFVMGYLQPTGTTNVGLHEMAHALRLQNIIRVNEFDFFDAELLDVFDQWADRVCAQMEEGGVRFFRPYACTNHQEFFAVAVENFFERPAAFKKELPELYGVMTRLLNQDPMTITQPAAV